MGNQSYQILKMDEIFQIMDDGDVKTPEEEVMYGM